MSDRIDLDAVDVRVREIVAEVLAIPPTDVRADSRFVEDLGADSFDQVSLLLALEDELEAEIPESEAGALRTVGSVTALIRQRLGER